MNKFGIGLFDVVLLEEETRGYPPGTKAMVLDLHEGDWLELEPDTDKWGVGISSFSVHSSAVRLTNE